MLIFRRKDKEQLDTEALLGYLVIESPHTKALTSKMTLMGH